MILPHCKGQALEIGIGGGRVAKKTLSLLDHLYAVDISAPMIKHAKANLQEWQDRTTFLHQSGENLPIELKGKQVDFCYCFDVFVHVDIHTVFRTLKQVRQVLKPGGLMMMSVANFCSEKGFQRFAKQD